MAITYALGYEPIWLLMDENSTPAGGGYIVSWRNLDRAQPKLIYQDPAGAFPFPNSGQGPTPNSYSIRFNMNGTAPGKGFYFIEDSSDPEETYFIQAYNSQGLLLWEAEGYLPGGSGGGSNVTEFITATNYIANNQFINHTGPSPITTTSLTNLVIAPSNHQGFTPAPGGANNLTGTYGVLGPDIRFLKNSTANSDAISFINFGLGDGDLTDDVTPVDYVNYVCTTSNAGETYKAFQFPITQKVQNLSNQLMTFRIWAKYTTTAATIFLYTRQYYGSGTAATPESAATYNQVGNMVLTTSWAPYVIQFTMPNVSGNSIGSPGRQTDDDAVYLHLGMPIDLACNISFTKPALYLGSIDPAGFSGDFEDYDQINSINSTPRCGDIRVSLTASAPLGWVPMNDGTIGNTGSGATLAAGGYVFQLYSTLYTSVIDTWAPVTGGRTGGGNTMANAVSDFLAGKTLKLPLSLGRAMAGAGSGSGLTTRVVGQNLGSEIITISAMPAHTHTYTAFTSVNTGTSTSSSGFNTVSGSLNTGSTGGGAASGNMQPTSFMNIFIKL